MEKFSQYRDRGTQIAPFLEITHPASLLTHLPIAITLVFLRLPFFIPLCLAFFLVLQWLPIGSLVRKSWLWMILLVGGVWWVDLQVEGVKKGSLSKQSTKLPRAGTVILSNFTSPIDVLYLAAVFDPIFTASYPTTTSVERLTLLPAILRSFSTPLLHPPPGATLIPLSALLTQNPTRTVAIFPESTPSNGRGILRFTPAIDTLPAKTLIFPISIRYTPADITTPIPGWVSGGKFLWRLLGGPTHCVRVRIAGAVVNDDREKESGSGGEEQEQEVGGSSGRQSRLCVRAAEALARMGRVKRLDLGVREKIEFVNAWTKSRKGK
ncbi:hypothetical protein DFH27DRAFT_475879 [Peziza echinospora]|nr:hypothetical protein DFH27DRAFT_475879 [Peziza echinospora]